MFPILSDIFPCMPACVGNGSWYVVCNANYTGQHFASWISSCRIWIESVLLKPASFNPLVIFCGWSCSHLHCAFHVFSYRLEHHIGNASRSMRVNISCPISHCWARKSCRTRWFRCPIAHFTAKHALMRISRKHWDMQGFPWLKLRQRRYHSDAVPLNCKYTLLIDILHNVVASLELGYVTVTFYLFIYFFNVLRYTAPWTS